MEHLESKHTMKFLEYLDSEKIVWQLTPLIKIGDQPE